MRKNIYVKGSQADKMEYLMKIRYSDGISSLVRELVNEEFIRQKERERLSLSGLQPFSGSAATEGEDDASTDEE